MMRILVIDDDGDIREILGEMLAASGYEVVEAGSGKEGVRLYREAPFDLVVTDLVMPEKDGLEVVMELRKDFPDVKIITLSGNAYGHSSLATSKAFVLEQHLDKLGRNGWELVAVAGPPTDPAYYFKRRK